MTSLSLPTFLRLKEGFSSSRSDGLNLGRRFNAGSVVQSSPRRVATVEPTAAMIAAFNRRYATGNFSYAMPALKRRPTFKPSLRDEEQARLASKIQRAKMWVMTRFPTCPTDDSRGESSVRTCRTGWEPVLHVASEKYLTDALGLASEPLPPEWR